MLDNLLKKNPILGVIIYPLLGLGAIWLGHYYSQSLSLLEKTGGKLKVNTFVYIAYQLGGTKLVMGLFILLALFFSTSQPESLIYAKMKLLRFKKEMR